MTREEKINWLINATNEQVIDQFKRSVIAISNGSIEQQIEGQEDYDLVTAEILKRMN